MIVQGTTKVYRHSPSRRGDEDCFKFLTLLIYKGKHLFWA
jgi:hypothetical protein